MSEDVIYCVDITVHSGTAPVTLHFATVGGIYAVLGGGGDGWGDSAWGDDPWGGGGGGGSEIYYEPRLKHPGNYTVNLFQSGTTLGHTQVGYGEVILTNTDGGLDYLIDYGFDGGDIVFKKYTIALGLVTIMSCSMEQATFTTTEMAIRIKDIQIKLNIPMQTTKYAGNNVLPNGVEGTDDIKGKPKPLLYGSCSNITPVLVNTSKLTYHISDTTFITSVVVNDVYDMGVSLTREADYADVTALEATAPSSGAYRVYPGGGYFRLGSTPAGQITVDAMYGAGEYSIGTITLMLLQKSFSSDMLVVQDYIDINNDLSGQHYSGLYVKEEMTVTEALDQILGPLGIWYAVDVNTGKLRAKMLKSPTGTPVLNITDWLNIEKVASNDIGRGIPIHKVNVQYDKNWTVQDSGLAGSVTYSGIPYWDNLSVTELAYPRHAHGVVIYKNFLYVVGGLVNGVASNSVMRLDLTNPTGLWDDTGVTNLLYTRVNHACVIHGNYLYVIGGDVNGVNYSASVVRLDLDNPSGLWDDVGVTDLSYSVRFPEAVVYGNYLYVAGGWISGVGISGKVTRLDLVTPSGSWDDAGVTDLPVPRMYFGLIMNGSYLYAIGGLDNIGNTLASVIRLNLTTPSGSWDTSSVTSLPDVRASFSTAIYDNYLYVIAGATYPNYAKTTRLNLDDVGGDWEGDVVPDLPEERANSRACVYKSNIFLIGGAVNGSGRPNTYIYRILVEKNKYQWLSQEFRSCTASDLNVLTKHPLSSEMNITILINTLRNAEQTATRLLNLHKVRRDLLKVTLSSSNIPFVNLGSLAQLTWDRFDYQSGKLMWVIGIELDWENDRTILMLWG